MNLLFDLDEKMVEEQIVIGRREIQAMVEMAGVELQMPDEIGEF